MRYWTPKLRTIRDGEWVQFDRGRRIAIIRRIGAGHPPRELLRADTWADDPLGRDFLGYFPVDELRLAAEMVWEVYQAAIDARKSRGRARAAA